MKIGIIGAMQKEVENLITKIVDLQEVKKQNITFYVGKLNNVEVVVVIGGVGKVASGMIVATMVNTFDDIEKIINVGVSGGNSDYVNRGDVVVGENYSYADVDLTPFGYEYGQIGDVRLFQGDKKMLDSITNDCHKGTILSGDKFFINKKEIDGLVKNHFSDLKVLAFDMESTALAQACYQYKIPYIAIRAISDVIGIEKQEVAYRDYVKIACQKANDILLEIIGGLN